ncbi:MAG: 3-dehydroquinate synthase [Candidatus Omnitrophica bacterium]|nr:3-dehydroquinate synthase [Candidatus Omnitrophota bacterium]
MKVIRVNLKQNPYSIYIGNGVTAKLPVYIKKLNLGDFAAVIVSRRVYTLYAKLINKILSGIPHVIIPVVDGEAAKSPRSALRVASQILTHDNWNKRLFIVCCGGGTIGDMGGFIASVYKRGVPFIQVPTTLLAQIDASIGGKTGIDLRQAKNIMGTFYQPKAVFIDPLFLKTLRTQEIKEGIAEAIKYGVIKKRELFYFLKNNYKDIMALESRATMKVIEECVRIKAGIVAQDEREKKGIRTILNFGHTLAHALEAAQGYKKITHGQAVALGMLYAAKLSLSLGRCAQRDVEELNQLIRRFCLPDACKCDYTNLCKSVSYDKKFISGKIRMVLMEGIGNVKVISAIPFSKLQQTLKEFSLHHCRA